MSGAMPLADLTARRRRGRWWRDLVTFGALAGAVLGVFAALTWLAVQYTNWTAESFTDRRLAKPLPAECEITRVLVRDLRDHEGAALLQSVGAAGEKLKLRAFAWRSSNARVGRGADWRGCDGFGPYVREMGMARFGSGEDGPLIYISRPILTAAGDEATVYETFRPPLNFHADDTDQGLAAGRAATRSWKLLLRRDFAGGPWLIVARAADSPPEHPQAPAFYTTG